jgi:hypothetical protein
MAGGSVMAAECTHGMPTPASCWECMEDGNLPTATRTLAAPAVEAVFTARFSGQCSACNLGIHEGQRIARMNDESYRHAHCAEAAA